MQCYSNSPLAFPLLSLQKSETVRERNKCVTIALSRDYIALPRSGSQACTEETLRLATQFSPTGFILSYGEVGLASSWGWGQEAKADWKRMTVITGRGGRGLGGGGCVWGDCCGVLAEDTAKECLLLRLISQGGL